MIKGRDIVIISSIDWYFLWQGPQEIALRFSRAGNRVLYIENTGVRAPRPGDLGRIRKRFSAWARQYQSQGLRRHSENIFVCSPLVLPPFGPGWQRGLNRALFLPVVRRAVRSLGMNDVVLWTYLPTDTAVELIRQLRSPKSVVVYYCAADFSLLTPSAAQLRESEYTLLRESDIVFAICEELSERCAAAGAQVHTFPYGVDISAFLPLEETAASQASVYPRPLQHPIVGYVGGMHRHVDFDLLAAMVRARRCWSWVFVGPFDESAHELAGLANTLLVGQQAHEDLARYIQTFDVCIVPYVKSAYTRTVVPVKINEYLALGKPVVSTDIRTVVEFNQQHQVLMTADNKPESFLSAIEAALRLPPDPATAARRREVACLGDWQSRIEAMSALIEEKIRRQSFS